MPDIQNKDNSDKTLLDLEKNAIMEELQDEFNEELDKTYLEFIDKMDEIKKRHQNEINKKLNIKPVQNSTPGAN